MTTETNIPLPGWVDVLPHLERAAVGHVATLLPDGAPHSVPVWIGARGDAVVFFAVAGSRKDRNLQRDPRIAVSITDPENPLSMASVRGAVERRIEGDEAWSIIDALSVKYTGAAYGDRSPHVAFVIRPTQAWATDYSAG